MTATEELRRLLDEHGVEWWPMHDVENGYYDDRDTEFLVYGCKYVAHEWGRRLHVDMLTPEQAIDATLGRGECRDDNSRFNAWRCSECGATVLLMFDDYGEPSYSVDGVADVPNFCPNCGRKVVDG